MSIEKRISPESLAEQWDVKVTTIRKYIRDGKLRAAKFGRGYRIAESDAEAFAAANTANIQTTVYDPAAGGDGTNIKVTKP